MLVRFATVSRSLPRFAADYCGQSHGARPCWGNKVRHEPGAVPANFFLRRGGVSNVTSVTSVTNQCFDFPSPPRFRCPVRDDRVATCGRAFLRFPKRNKRSFVTL